jgi:hypothetical protein
MKPTGINRSVSIFDFTKEAKVKKQNPSNRGPIGGGDGQGTLYYVSDYGVLDMVVYN